MASYSDTVVDDSGYRRPLTTAAVYILNMDGTLVALTSGSNPIDVDDYGSFSFEAADGVYLQEVRLGGVTYDRQTITVGNPPQYVGPAGPSNNTRVSLAALKAASIGDKTSLYDGSLWTWTLGNYTGKADDQNIVKADSTSLSVGAWVRQATTGLTHKPQFAPAIVTASFLDRFGLQVEDATGIQQANDYARGLGSRRTILLPPGAGLTQSAGISIDASFVAFDARGASLTTAQTSGAAITITGTAGLPYEQNLNVLRLPLLRGPGKASMVDGVLMDSDAVSPAQYGPAQLTLAQPNIGLFRNGLIMRNRAYLVEVIGAAIGGCATCVWQDAAQDGSENNRLIAGVLYNSDLGVRLTPNNCDFHLDGTSLDALSRLAVVDAGILTLNDVHVEVVGATSYASTPFVLGGEFARVYWDGGSRRVPSGLKTFDYWVDGTGTFVDMVHDAQGDMTVTGAFAGSNVTFIRPGRIGGNETRDNCYMAQINKSRVVDPTFATLAANSVFIVPNGGNYTLLNRYTEQFQGNTSSVLMASGGKLVHSKPTGFGGGSPAAFRLAIPFEAQDLAGGRIFYEKADSSSGPMSVSLGWGYADPVPAGPIPNFVKVVDYASATVSFTSAAVPATPITFTPMSSHRAPPGATHLILTVVRSNMSAGDVLFSNPNFDRVG